MLPRESRRLQRDIGIFAFGSNIPGVMRVLVPEMEVLPSQGPVTLSHLCSIAETVGVDQVPARNADDVADTSNEVDGTHNDRTDIPDQVEGIIEFLKSSGLVSISNRLGDLHREISEDPMSFRCRLVRWVSSLISFWTTLSQVRPAYGLTLMATLALSGAFQIRTDLKVFPPRKLHAVMMIIFGERAMAYWLWCSRHPAWSSFPVHLACGAKPRAVDDQRDVSPDRGDECSPTLSVPSSGPVMGHTIPDEHHVARYCMPNRHVENGWPTPSAFQLRPVDKGTLSVNWLEFFTDQSVVVAREDREAPIEEIRRVIQIDRSYQGCSQC